MNPSTGMFELFYKSELDSYKKIWALKEDMKDDDGLNSEISKSVTEEEKMKSDEVDSPPLSVLIKNEDLASLDPALTDEKRSDNVVTVSQYYESLVPTVVPEIHIYRKGTEVADPLELKLSEKYLDLYDFFYKAKRDYDTEED